MRVIQVWLNDKVIVRDKKKRSIFVLKKGGQQHLERVIDFEKEGRLPGSGVRE